ncbi:PSP1 C-terminal conserved region-domain-containing protein [Russula earlei]|uniref:PSP1 C-terminal conserved region-domain-containing protein n=1 Tax=Russula earlei TaxID=71964 RepID=A0ACC0UE57_9AGAM|nr:PSP1 C-terminal conserved region-domain-containing protein [Russula earlei]
MMAHPVSFPYSQPEDDADRRNRFASAQGLDSAGPASLRERAASQPPRTSSQNFLSSHQAVSPSVGRANPPWAQRPPPSFNPGSFPGRSSSFSTTAPSLQNSLSAMREARAFASTFEDDESEATSDAYDDRFIHTVPSRGRSYGAELTRSRSQSLATRPGPVGSTYGQPGLAGWNDSGFGSNPLSIPGRIAETKPFATNRYGYCWYLALISFDDRFLALNLFSIFSYSSHPADISNMSPFVRNVNEILLDDGSFRELWSGTGMHDNTNGGGSGTTSRRHSVSVVQPRRGIIGFSAPGVSADDEPNPRTSGQFFGQSTLGLGRGGLLLSDEDLADDLSMLSLGKDGPGPVSSSSGLPPSQPSSLPIYAPLSRSPERFSPYQNLNLTIPSGRQTLGEANDTGLSSGGSSSLGHPDFQEQAPQSQHVLTARFIPGQGIKYIPQPVLNDAGFAARSPISPRAAPSQQHHETHGLLSTPVQRRASDAHSHLPQPRQSINDLGKGVPLHAVPASCPLYIVEFKAGRTDLFYATDLTLDIRVGDLVIVEADRGKDLGKVVNDSITLAEVEAFQKQQQQQQSSHVGYAEMPTSPGEQSSLSAGGAGSKKEINPKMIYGKAGTQDAQLLVAKMQDEVKALQLCQNKVRQKKLPMDVVDAEYQWDRRKLTFYFVAEKRIDFRELVRELFRLYKTRIWMASLQGPAGLEQ